MEANPEPVDGAAGSPEFDSGRTAAERMRAHAGQQQHLYAIVMRAMADDWEAGGPVRTIWTEWEDAPPGSAIQLRLLAGLFRIVLTGRAPELVGFYPCLGGQAPAAEAWPVVRRVMGDNVDELRAALEVAPQTNEPARSVGLLLGIFDAVGRSGLSRVRLLEPGASAGLNLLVDQFRFVTEDWAFGPAVSPLTLCDGVDGPVSPLPFEIVARRGCDLSPVDPRSAVGQVRLRSFVWPFEVERHERLTAALEIAARHPVTVDQAAAGEWLEALLITEPPDDVVTVVWHSMTRLYWPAEETARVQEAISSARRRMPIVHVCLEYPQPAGAIHPELVAQGPGDEAPRRLGRADDHGGRVTLDPVTGQVGLD